MTQPMRVLIACEESQEVCKAFRARGHEAYSCDIQPCSGGHPEWHIQDDVLNHLNDGWDLMVAHPPCTYFAAAGMHYLNGNPERQALLDESFELVRRLWTSTINRIAIENPIGWLNTNWRKPTQIIQPYYFGDNELKTTCLWLKGLSRLQGLLEVAINPMAHKPKALKSITRKSGTNAGKEYKYYWRQGKSAKARSKTFPGIARAMAEQWG